MTTETNIGERKAVRRLMRHLHKHGFTVTHVDTGERIPVSTMDDIIEHVFSVDDSYVTVASEVDIDGTVRRREHCICIVLGNDPSGCEIVADYSFANNDPDGFDKCINAFIADE